MKRQARDRFIELFQMLFNNESLHRRLRHSGCDDQKIFQTRISLSGVPYEQVMESARGTHDQLTRLDEQWTKRLKKVDKNSSCYFELNSLFGKNYLRLHAENYQHYLKYFVAAGEQNLASKVDLDWSSSLYKVETLLNVEKVFRQKPYKGELKRCEVKYFCYESSENPFELVLQFLAAKEPVGDSDFLRRSLVANQILLCTRCSASEELQSKPVFVG